MGVPAVWEADVRGCRRLGVPAVWEADVPEALRIPLISDPSAAPFTEE